MRDPAFVQAIRENDDLCAAIQLQRRLDEEEALHSPRPTPGSLATTPHTRPGRMLWDSSITPSSLSAVVSSEVKSRLRSLLQKAQEKKKQTMPNHESRQLVEQLEALNRENKEEQVRRKIRRDAQTTCLEAVHNHLESYLKQHPNDATYEKWIEELHPENAYEGQLLQGMDKTIDHRFYVESSDHRKIWNESLLHYQGKNRNNSTLFVPVRVGGGGAVEDLLTDTNHRNGAPSSASNNDDLFGSFPSVATSATALDTTTLEEDVWCGTNAITGQQQQPKQQKADRLRMRGLPVTAPTPGFCTKTRAIQETACLSTIESPSMQIKISLSVD